MPTSIFFNGQRRYRPNVYTRVINNLGQATEAATGNIALVGDFPELKQATPIRFTSQLDFTEWFRGINPDLKTLSPLMFNPLDGDATITSLTVVSANNSTAASTTQSGIKISSRLFGVSGNRISTELTANAGDASLFDIKVKDAGVEKETVNAFGEGTIATIGYTIGANDFGSLFSVMDDDGLEIHGGKLGTNAVIIAGSDLLNGLDTHAAGNITLTLTEDQTTTSTFSIVGLDQAGIPQGETINIPATALDNETFVSTTSFSRVTSITCTTNAATFVGDINVKVPLFYKTRAEITDLEATLAELVSLNSEIAGTFDTTAPASVVTGAMLDNNTQQISVGDQSLTINTHSLFGWFNGSEYVSAERVSNVAPTTFTARLTGGSKASSLSASDWQAALDIIKREDINIISPFTDDQPTQALVATHAVTAAQEAGYERNVWVGTAAATSISNTFTTYSKAFNDRNVAVTNQSITVGGVSLDPRFTAALFAAMQGATPIATPLTRKRPTTLVTATTENFNREEDAGLAIRRGIVFFADPSNTGLRIERSVTTWLKDDNPVYSEVSANESVNNCIREVRSSLQSQVGTAITAGRSTEVQRVAQNTLFDLKKNGLIADYRDLSVTLVGDAANVVFSLAALEPLNFITVTTNVVR